MSDNKIRFCLVNGDPKKKAFTVTIGINDYVGVLKKKYCCQRYYAMETKNILFILKCDLLKIVFDENVRSLRITVFASEYVAEKVTDKFIENYKTRLRHIVTESSSINGLKGRVNEGIIHRILQKGGRFNVRCLDSDISSIIKLPERTKKLMFNDINEIKEDNRD
ncbi:1826_t:CDS:2 [Diversispora eburnea]|uniref:1826_t:CDS:1 n=1 Tax=Diversispora eburnea TaxID=1213867 RepID=A0A9N8YM53_9GLOM|nr:1826_t:CDS:2 [Diversispora eburnea]